jgi:mono/diheme cytochrome c family protein
MLKFVLSAVLLVIIGASALVSACGGQQQTPTPAAPTASTAAQLADAGKAVFASHCARCHGNNGQGVTAPAIIGANASLGKYNTGQGLLSFVSTVMPANAPGSLSQQDYLDVVSYLLVQNNFVTPGTTLDAGRLSSINLK